MKVLKEISDNCELSNNAKKQLNSLLRIITVFIVERIRELLIISNNHSITIKECSNSILLLLDGELCDNAINEGNAAVQRYITSSSSGNTQTKAQIIFSPKTVVNIAKDRLCPGTKIRKKAGIFIASVLEYLTYEILDLAVMHVKEKERIRIFVRDLHIVTSQDKEISMLLKKINSSFVGCGVVPHIYSDILSTRNTTVKQKLRNAAIIKDIKEQQKSINNIIPEQRFKKIVRIFFKDTMDLTSIKISSDAYETIQHYIENYITGLLQKANSLAIYSDRVKVTTSDIVFTLFMCEDKPNPLIPTPTETSLLSMYEIPSNNTPTEELESVTDSATSTIETI